MSTNSVEKRVAMKPPFILPYSAVIGARFRLLLQYRAAALAGFVTQIGWGAIRIMAMEAFYRSTTAPQPMGIEDVVTYIWLGQALLGMLPWNPDTEIRAMVRSGTVAYELVRPVNLYGYWFSRSFAFRLTPTLMRSVPLIALALLFFGMQPPASPEALAVWLAATAGALLLSTALTVILSITLMWTVSGDGIHLMVPPLIYFLAGMVIPLPLFPDWAQYILGVLPFRGIFDAPFRLYMGHIPLTEAWAVLLHQWIWIIALVGLGAWLLSKATRRLVIQGG